MEGQKKGYGAAGTPPVIKQYRAVLFSALRDAGVPLDVLWQANEKTSFSVAKRTLQLHIKKLGQGGAVLSNDKKSGGQPALTDEEWHVVAGAILAQEKKVDSVWVRTFVREYFGHDFSESSISRHMDELDLSYQLTGRRKRKKKKILE